MMSYRSFTIITVALLLSSCVEPIVMDPLEEMPVVVNCVLHSTTPGLDAEEQTLDLYYAARPSAKEYAKISNASVIVSGGGQTHVFEWNGTNYSCTFRPVHHTEYTLKILLPDGRKITASTIYPDFLGLGSKEVDVGATDVFRYKYYYVCGNSSGRDVYMWFIPKKGEKTIRLFSTSHPGADGFNITYGSWDDFFKNVSMDYPSDYWKRYLEICSGRPLYAGFLRIHHPADFDNGIPYELTRPSSWTQFESGITDRQLFMLEVDYYYYEAPPWWYEPGVLVFPMTLHFLSEEYDAYLRALVSSTLVNADELVNVFSPKVDNTNIQGGLGIFGSDYTFDYCPNYEQL